MLPSNVDDLRLIWAVVLNAAVFAAAYLLAGRFVRSRSQAVCDAFLGLFAVQYIAVCLPGMAGVLNAATMSVVAIGCCLAMSMAGWRRPNSKQKEPPRSGRLRERRGTAIAIAAAGFVISYLAIYVFVNSLMPPIATDPLVYHLPTAVWWLQHHSLAIYPTWYWNPAASYCPLSGSAFIVWLMAPMGNDVLARFVQVPAALFIFALVVRLCRLTGCSRAASGLIAVAAVMARPFLSESLFPKDDLFVTAFIGAAVVACASENLRGRLGPWRCGIALGMVLASKYTVLLACPVLLFLIDAPVRARWRWRQWATAIGTTLLLAGGWYLRNWIRFGDPLYPVDVNLFGHRIFTGLFGTERDVQLQTAAGVWRMVGNTYLSLPWPLIGMLAVLWLSGLIAGIRDRSAWRDPLRRACLLGAPATLGLFVLTSPHHEVRYLFPLLLLFFACAGMAVAGWLKQSRNAGIVAGILAATSIATSFAWDAEVHTLFVIGWALLGAAIAGAIGWLRPGPALILRGAGVAALVLLGAQFVCWDSYLQVYQATRLPIWDRYYSDMAGAWHAVDRLRPEATVAYANTYFVYPLYDFRLQRRVVYAPVRRGLHDFSELPRLGDAVPGDQIVQTMTKVMDADADSKTWYPNLAAAGADYLMIVKDASAAGLDAHPPELQWARADPVHFERVFEDANTVLYRIHYTSRW
jgi:hypothetical protein